MDWLTFIAEIVKALAWPVTALIIFGLLRRPLFAILPYIQRLSYGGIELDFSSQVRDLAVRLRRELPPITLSERLAQARLHLVRLAELSPRAAILEGWLLLEEAAAEASRRRELNLSSQELRTPLILGQRLEAAGILDQNKAEIYHRLRNLRNAAAHASEFAATPEAALEYANLAVQLAEYIRSA